MAERVNGAQCRLEAVLSRLTLPLSEVMKLTEGMVLALPQAGVDQISLEGCDGRRVAEGRLGQNRGMRAIRLSDAANLTAPGPVPGLMTEDGFGDAGHGFGGAEMEEGMYQATGTD